MSDHMNFLSIFIHVDVLIYAVACISPNARRNRRKKAAATQRRVSPPDFPAAFLSPVHAIVSPFIRSSLIFILSRALCEVACKRIVRPFHL